MIGDRGSNGRLGRWTVVVGILAITAFALGSMAAFAGAGTGEDQVCPDLDTGHLSAGDATSLVITAPEGLVIVQVCVKAGSAQQGDGPEFINFDPGVTETTISHSTGKEISHYSVLYGPAPETTVPTTTPGGVEVGGESAVAGSGAASAVEAAPSFTG
jgi:hypothetical protein